MGPISFQSSRSRSRSRCSRRARRASRQPAGLYPRRSPIVRERVTSAPRPARRATRRCTRSGRAAGTARCCSRPTAGSVRGDFARAASRCAAQRYELRAEDGEWFITETYLTGRPHEQRVDYTLGNRRIQHYLTTMENGRIVVLPPSWDVQRREWFHNLDIVRPVEDERRHGPAVEQELPRLPRQPPGEELPTRRAAPTRRVADFGTTCERCHGPGSAHVQR